MYYLILSGDTHSNCLPANQQRVSFGNRKHDVCFGHTKPDIIPNYMLEDYLNEYGNEVIDTYERDANYNLIPCRKTIVDSISSWNRGAREYKNRNI